MLQWFAAVGQPRGKVRASWESFLDLLGARNASSEECPVLRSRKIITSSTTHTQLETRVPLGTVLRTWLRSTLLRQTSFLRSALRQPVLRTKPPSPSRIDVASIPDTHPPGPPQLFTPMPRHGLQKNQTSVSAAQHFCCFATQARPSLRERLPAFPLPSIPAALSRARGPQRLRRIITHHLPPETKQTIVPITL